MAWSAFLPDAGYETTKVAKITKILLGLLPFVLFVSFVVLNPYGICSRVWGSF